MPYEIKSCFKCNTIDEKLIDMMGTIYCDLCLHPTAERNLKKMKKRVQMQMRTSVDDLKLVKKTKSDEGLGRIRIFITEVDDPAYSCGKRAVLKCETTPTTPVTAKQKRSNSKDTIPFEDLCVSRFEEPPKSTKKPHLMRQKSHSADTFEQIKSQYKREMEIMSSPTNSTKSSGLAQDEKKKKPRKYSFGLFRLRK